MNNIAIFGGTFNPVHNDHINLIKTAINELELDLLIVVPTFISPHKIGREVAGKEDRLNMLNLALSSFKKVLVSDYELNKGGVSYSFETVTYFKKLYNPQNLYFIVGSDMLEDFPTWKNPQIIVDNAILTLAERQDTKYDNSLLIKNVETLYNTKIKVLQNFEGTVRSSNLLRSYVKLNLCLEDFTTKRVEYYIYSKNLYSGDEYYSYIKSVLPTKRLIHTAGVIATAIKLSKKAGVDYKKAELSALLHDNAKYLDYKEYEDFVLPKGCVKNVIHQFLGSYIAETKLNILDTEILDAIKYHSTGRENMTELEKLIFVADLIEPSRTFKGVDEIRLEVEKDFEKGFRFALKEIYRFLKESNEEIYYLTKNAYEYYCK